MKGFFGNIEKITGENGDYRRVLYTGKHSQLVVMKLLPGEEIGEEIHADVDQFFRFESGKGRAMIDGNEHEVADGDSLIVPAGAKHNVMNASDAPLLLYTLYSPPNHKDGTRHPSKADEAEEHFDGVTTE